jgi:hypothetical protein
MNIGRLLSLAVQTADLDVTRRGFCAERIVRLSDGEANAKLCGDF